MANCNPDIVYETAFIQSYMDEGTIYHTNCCSFMWTGSTIYFMEVCQFDIAIVSPSTSIIQLGAFQPDTFIRFYTITDSRVAHFEERPIKPDELNQEKLFSDYLTTVTRESTTGDRFVFRSGQMGQVSDD